MPSIRPTRLIVIAALLSAPVLIAQVPSASDPPRYALPPKAIVDVFDSEFLPQTLVNPNRQVVVLTKARPYPTIAELAQPMCGWPARASTRRPTVRIARPGWRAPASTRSR